MRYRTPFPLILLYLLACVQGAVGQSVRDYKILKVPQDQSINIPVEAEDYPSVLSVPKHGTVDKFKLNFESQYRIKYSPESGWSGIDTLVFQTLRKEHGSLKPFFEAYILEVAPIIANDDYYSLDVRATDQTLDLLANDLLIGSEAKIDRLAFVSNGQAFIREDSAAILFTPGVVGHATITYVVADGGSFATARVFIRTSNEANAPRSDTSFYEIDKDATVTLLLPQGYSPPSAKYFGGVLKQTGDLRFEYKPAMGYTGTEEIKFIQLYDGKFFTQTFVIKVRDPFEGNGVTYPDLIYTEMENLIDFSVLENDIAQVMESFDAEKLQGQLRHLGDGQFRYRPPANWEGHTGFTYESCFDGRCDVENVRITVFNFPPRDDQVSVSTTQNDALHMPYLVPIDAFHFEAVLAPHSGTLNLVEDGRALMYAPNQDYVGIDDFSVNYCTTNDGVVNCAQIDVTVVVESNKAEEEQCNTDCVWPGDLNTDGVVDVSDILSLGVNLGKAGPSRTDQDVQAWYGRSALSWDNVRRLGGQDLKHVDANGDGLVSYQDIEPISAHYLKAHTLVPALAPTTDVESVHVELITPEVEEGDWATVEISVKGSQAEDYIMGLSFSLEINEQYVNSSSFTFDLEEQGVFEDEGDVLTYTVAPKAGQYDVGLVSITGKAVATQGVVGQVSFIIEEDLNGFRSLKDIFEIDLFIKRLMLLRSNGEYQGLPDAKGTMLYRKNMVTEKQGFSFYPNPAQTYLLVDGGDQEIIETSIYSLGGQLLMHHKGINKTSLSLNLQKLQPGPYLLRTQLADGNIITEQIEIF